MPPEKKSEKESRLPLMTRFFHGCLLGLAGVFIIWLALQLLGQVWGYLLIIAITGGVIWGIVWLLRWRRDRRW